MEKFLEVRDLSKYYEQDDRKIYALKDINLFIEKGDIYGIIGESGAGKSTLIRLLASLLKPSNGHILFQEVDISGLEGKSLREFRQNIGMIFQHFNLLTSRTAAENISYPMEIAGLSKEEREKKALELLRLVNLSDKQDAHPLQLSGGEKQRVGIARAIATNPEILFC
ncbi:MAG TPA: ATP-binding cassette domain-containing protein, partial [Chlamydiales bacterium]|nr:ATP-binding cassette domain-containing protein [Chlamydiales bacterium]